MEVLYMADFFKDFQELNQAILDDMDNGKCL